MSETGLGRPIKILLVEDNPGDVRLITEALKDGKILNEMHVVDDGEAALAWLRRDRPYVDVPRPDIILLDLNLPKKNGQEVLVEIKTHPEFRRIPVCIITSSSGDKDILDAYNHHANCYITKPVDLTQFVKLVQSVRQFWFTIVTLPPE